MRRRVILGVAFAILVLGAAAAVLPAVGRWYIRSRVFPLLESRLQRKLEAKRLALTTRHILLEEVRVSSAHDLPGVPMVSALSIEVDYALGSLLGGKLVARRVVVRDPLVYLVRHGDGSTNFVDLLLRPRRGDRSRTVRVDEVVVERGKLLLEDEAHHVSLVTESLEGRVASGRHAAFTVRGARISFPRIARDVFFDRVVVSARLGGGGSMPLPRVQVEGGRVQLLPHLGLSGISGTFEPDATMGKVTIALEGSYGGAEAKLWSARGWVDTAGRKGKLDIKAARFSLGRVASVLGRTPIILPARTMVDGELALTFDAGALGFRGGFEVTHLSLFHPGLARTAVLDLSGGVRLGGRLDLPAEKLVVDELGLHSRGVEVKLAGSVERMFGQRKIALRLEVPPVPCQTVLDAFPPSLVPELQGFQLKGTFRVDLGAEVDFRSLSETQLGGRVAIDRCKVIKAPEAADAERFLAAFEREVEPAPGDRRTLVVGPENFDFTPYANISPYMIRAVLTTEDAGFFRHHGFIPSQFRAALARNLEKGGFRLGASTISMQLVKNVLLGPEKTLSRKLQELFLTWYLEQRLSKERMMEIYLNVIEFGPGIYGVGAGAQHYFGKSARDLTPLEAAFFASILPSPKRRYVQYCRGELTPGWDRYVRRLLRRMAEKGHVDAAALAAAQEEKIVFVRDKEALPEADCERQLKELLEASQEEDRRRLREAVLEAAPHQLEMFLGPEGQPGDTKRTPR